MDIDWHMLVYGILVPVAFLVDAIALARGASWAYRFGFGLPWRTERVDLRLPDDLHGDGLAPTEVMYTPDLDDHRTAVWLDADRIGLLYWGLSLGARNTVKIRALRGLGVVASGLIRIERAADHVTFHWRPVLRPAPVLLLGVLLGTSGLTGPAGLAAPLVWTAMYLAAVWWTLRSLPEVYDAVTAELVAAAARASA